MTSITAAPLLSVDLPTDEQQTELLRMVGTAYPQLRLPADSDAYSHRHQFGRAMRYCAYARRVPEPATGFYFTFWLDDCRQFLDRHGYLGGVGLPAFVAAIVASAITYAPLINYPHDLSFGLGRGDASHPSAAWRDVLRDGIPKPTEPKNYVRPRTQNIDVTIR